MTSREISPTAARRFSAKYLVDTDTGCWNWTAGGDGRYGHFFLFKKMKGHAEAEGAHRASWILNRGAIPNGMLVCHKCDNTQCVNPDHLFLGTSQDNNDDMRAKGRERLIGAPRQKECKSGHALTADNLKVSGNRRFCLQCFRARDAEAHARSREANREKYNAYMRAYRAKQKAEEAHAPH